MDFSGDGTLAVSVLDGFELLRPPAFRRVGMVGDGAGAMDHNVFMRWSRSGEQMMVLSDYGCAIYEPGTEEPVATFEAEGLFLAQATSPAADETAVLYSELLAVHGADGGIAARTDLEAASGQVRWSHDGQLLVATWRRDDASGFTVFGREGLRVLRAAERSGGDAHVPVAWHPSRNTLAFADGSAVRLRDFQVDAEAP